MRKQRLSLLCALTLVLGFVQPVSAQIPPHAGPFGGDYTDVVHVLVLTGATIFVLPTRVTTAIDIGHFAGKDDHRRLGLGVTELIFGVSATAYGALAASELWLRHNHQPTPIIVSTAIGSLLFGSYNIVRGIMRIGSRPDDAPFSLSVAPTAGGAEVAVVGPW